VLDDFHQETAEQFQRREQLLIEREHWVGVFNRPSSSARPSRSTTTPLRQTATPT